MADDLIIESLRGGMNDTDPAHMLAKDQVVQAENIEWFHSSVGERRMGCTPLSMTGAGFTGQATIVHLSQWFPSNDILSPELWAVAATPGTSGQVPSIARRSGTFSGLPTWTAVTAADALLTDAPAIYNIVTQSVNGKLFWAYKSLQDRLHVWDGSGLRRAGLAQPAAPTAATEGAGTYIGVRYFRVRFIRKIGTAIPLRSEPSLSVKFTPPGTGAGTTVTRPALLGESETHWELEASADDATFYRIQTLAANVLTANDEIARDTGYATGNSLSESIGTYLLLPSARFLGADGDRLLGAGHQTDLTQMSDIWWTPVINDPGTGNDERRPLERNNKIALDNYDNGPITGIGSAVSGVWYAFKWSAIYRMTRTGNLLRAYEVRTLSKRLGAIPGSIFPGLDENGDAVLYFLDPVFGASRIGPAGPQVIRGLRKTWRRVNTKASGVTARGQYYPYKKQCHWWVAADGANLPTLKLVLQVSEVRPVDDGVGRGWSLATGRIAQANAVTTYNEWVNDDGNITLSERPFIGLTAPDFIQRCDEGSTDAGVPYTATLKTKPYYAAGLLGKWGTMVASLLADANAAVTFLVRLIRDSGVETSTPVSVTPAPVGAEDVVVRLLDQLAMSGASAIQVKISDA